jgi:hypothetical protein
MKCTVPPQNQRRTNRNPEKKKKVDGAQVKL